MADGWMSADLGEGVLAGFTTREGGVSGGEFEGLNLALHVGDLPSAVAANRRELAARVGAPVFFARQVHGRDVAVAPGTADPAAADPATTDLPDADAVLAAERGIAVGVLVADCVPVLLADAGAGVAAAAHAGRKGLVAGVLGAAVSAMTARGARPGEIRAAVGPAAGGCCYEVPAAMRDEVGAVWPSTPGETDRGTPSLDLRAGAVEALRAAGVGDATLVGGCTITDHSLYSFRRAALTGRFAGVVRVLP